MSALLKPPPRDFGYGVQLVAIERIERLEGLEQEVARLTGLLWRAHDALVKSDERARKRAAVEIRVMLGRRNDTP